MQTTMKTTITDVQLLAAAYAEHCLSKMSSDSTEDEKIAMLWNAYNDAKTKIANHIQQVEPPTVVTAI